MMIVKDLAFSVEKTMFELLYRSDDKGGKYFNRGKAIASNLQDKKNFEFRTRVIEGDLTPLELVQMDVKDMASTELQSKRKQVEKEAFNSLRSDWHDVFTPVSEGLHVCEKCGGCRTTSKEIQMRSADEPATLY
jgi:hypothetical protein